MLVVNNKLKIPLRELDFTFVRGSGPGGQNVNKLNTKAVLRWDVVGSPSLPEAVRQRFLNKHARRVNKEGELVLASHRFRDQGRNVADCLEKLRGLLEEVARPPKRRKKTKPTRASKERRLREKKQKADKKRLRKSPKLDG